MDDPNDPTVETVDLIMQLTESMARKIAGGLLFKFVLQLEQWSDPTIGKVKAALVMALQEEFFDPRSPGGINLDKERE